MLPLPRLHSAGVVGTATCLPSAASPPPQAVSVPDELSALQSLEALCIEYAQLVQLPEAVQVRCSAVRGGTVRCVE